MPTWLNLLPPLSPWRNGFVSEEDHPLTRTRNRSLGATSIAGKS